MGSNFGKKFATALRNWGEGRQVQQIPKWVPLRFNNFKGGFNVADVDQDVSDGSSPDCLDMEVSKRDSLIKASGTEVYEVLSALKSPSQIGLFVSLSLQQEMLLFDPPYVGIKKDAATPVLWVSTPIPGAEIKPFFWTTYADTFIFANGNGSVYTHEIASDLFVADPLIPNGASLAVSAARLLVGGAVIDGIRQPMVMAWSGTEGFNKFDFVSDLGSGFEALVADQTVGDAIVAVRAMGLDLVAVVCLNSVWIGRRTGDLDRPHDYQPRVTGSGAIVEACVKTVLGGVMYLSSEGVEFFDGNTSTHVSEAIDTDLMPIDYANLDKYTATYDPTRQRYILFTPLCTYVFDMRKARWYKRSLIALGGVPFAEALPPTSWADAIGSWADSYETWLTMSGDNKSLPVMTFLGVDADFLYALHKENYGSYSHFGHDFKPRWQSVLIESPVTSDLVTTDTYHLRYKQGGEMNLYLPDINGALARVNQTNVVLDVSAQQNLVRFKSMWTGLQGGFKIEYLSGVPEVSEVELRVLPRGPRITPGFAFVPREFEADF